MAAILHIVVSIDPELPAWTRVGDCSIMMLSYVTVRIRSMCYFPQISGTLKVGIACHLTRRRKLCVHVDIASFFYNTSLTLCKVFDEWKRSHYRCISIN